MTENTTPRTRKFASKKKIAIVTTALLLVGGGGAFAYWSTTGAGTGSAANAGSNGTIVLTATFAPGLTPGSERQVAFTGANAGTTDLQVGTITSVVSTTPSTCLATDFTIAPVLSNTTVEAGDTNVNLGTGTLAFANSAINQDACKSATVTLTLTSN